MPNAPKRHNPYVRRAKAPSELRRGNSAERGYDHKWRAATKLWLAQQFAAGNFRCAKCGKMLGGERREIHVDHIKAHKGQHDPLFWDTNNWAALHPWCHSKKTATEDGAFGHRKKQDG